MKRNKNRIENAKEKKFKKSEKVRRGKGKERKGRWEI